MPTSHGFCQTLRTPTIETKLSGKLAQLRARLNSEQSRVREQPQVRATALTLAVVFLPMKRHRPTRVVRPEASVFDFHSEQLISAHSQLKVRKSGDGFREFRCGLDPCVRKPLVNPAGRWLHSSGRFSGFMKVARRPATGYRSERFNERL